MVTLLTYIRFAAYAVLSGMLVIRALVDRRERTLSVTASIYFGSRVLITLTQTFGLMGPVTGMVADWLTTPMLLAMIFLYARQIRCQYQWQARDRRAR